jgi:predicted component of type VI protein secretion system
MPYIEHEHQSRSLGPGVLTIGSGTEAGWRILGRDLAPVHAVVTVEKGGYALFVSGTPEATIFVNGDEVADGKVHVRYGDRVRLGKAEFRYLQLARGNDGRGGYLREMRRGRSYHLGDFTEIGRDPKCGVFIPEPEVSRVHAEIRRENGHFVVVPRNALTLRNGQRITAGVALAEGDELSIGRTTLRFSAEPTGQTVEANIAHRPGGDQRRMQMPTTFMGAYEAAERAHESGRRRMLAFIAAAAALAISIGALLAR